MAKIQIKKILFVSLLILIGCSNHKRGYIFFLDYTQSVFALNNSEKNRFKINYLLQDNLSEFNTGDLFEIYPIHTYTQTATPLVRLHGPTLRGDLRDRNRWKEWKTETALPEIKKIWRAGFQTDRKMQTNIYPTVRKIYSTLQRGYKVKAVIISDMIQDYDGEHFEILFTGNSRIDPIQYAHEKVAKSGFEGILRGAEVIVKIPGSIQGVAIYDKIRPRVNTFWQEFFEKCGATVVIEDL